MPGIVGDAGEANRGDLPDVIVAYLGDSDVELIAQLFHQRLYDAALALERVVLRQPERNPADAYGHAHENGLEFDAAERRRFFGVRGYYRLDVVAAGLLLCPHVVTRRHRRCIIHA